MSGSILIRDFLKCEHTFFLYLSLGDELEEVSRFNVVETEAQNGYVNLTKIMQ